MVTEFQYAAALVDAFENGNLEALAGLGTDAEWLPSDQAIIFVDNHDTQRSHIGDEILNYRDGARYELAVAFMLAYPYGYPMVMSSYTFEDDDQGPPASSPHDDNGCGTEWVCEHRRPAIADMVAFRKTVAGTDINNWRIDDKIISFGRGDKGHVVINTSDAAASPELATNLPDGNYDAASVIDGTLRVTVPALGAIAIFQSM
jgi:alpha-amylase